MIGKSNTKKDMTGMGLLFLTAEADNYFREKKGKTATQLERAGRSPMPIVNIPPAACAARDDNLWGTGASGPLFHRQRWSRKSISAN